MTYEPTNWKKGDKITSVNLNKLESGIAAFYPQETIIAPEQTVTITAETDAKAGAPITLAEGIDLSTFSEADLEALSVSINGEAAEFSDDEWSIEWDGSNVRVHLAPNLTEETTYLTLIAFNKVTQDVQPGDYTVEITKGAPARIPAVAAFPVSAGSGNVMWVIDTPKEDVDAARANGCVLLYAADPDSDAVFAFGCLVGNAMYYYAASGGEFVWNSGTVTLRDGKYVVLDES